MLTSKELKSDVPTETLVVDLVDLIPKLMKTAVVPGLCIGIIRNAELLWSQGFGVTNIETPHSITPDTVFQSASLSKPVFAYGVQRLCERGTLNLDMPLTEYLPQPHISDSRLNRITARIVLSHTTGFPNWASEDKPLATYFPPGERFTYSGEGYVYLQKVVEHLTQQHLNEYMTHQVFKPLGMHRSSYVWVDKYKHDGAIAGGHDSDGDSLELRKRSEAIAAASMYTTVKDFAKFLTEMMEPKASSTQQIAEMLTPQFQLTDSLSWGLGWGIQHTAAEDSFWHWGSNYHARHFVAAFRERKIGVIILTNSHNGIKICQEIAEKSIGGHHPAFGCIEHFDELWCI